MISWCISYEIAQAGDLTDDSVNTGLGNGLVPSDNKPLPGPVLTKISDAIRCRCQNPPNSLTAHFVHINDHQTPPVHIPQSS